MMGGPEDSSGGFISLSNILGSAGIGKLLSSLQYSAHLFSTSALSVRRLPPLS